MAGVHEQLCIIQKLDKDKPRKKITILGAGMAGLAAGYELKQLGHSVEIIEATDRVGGRVRTHRFKDGQYGELGAMRIPKGHDYTRYYIGLFPQLSLRTFVSAHQNFSCFYDIRDVQTRIKNAETNLFPLFNLTPAEHRAAMVEIPDGTVQPVAPNIMGTHFAEARLGLTKEDEDSLFAFQPITERARQLDSESLFDFLRRRVRGVRTLELIGSTTGLDMLWDRSIAWFLRDEIVGTSDGLQEIKDGMEGLPNALRDTFIQGEIKYNTEMLALSRVGKKAKLVLRTDGGKSVEKECEWLICTIPFGVLRRLDLAGFSPAKMQAIRDLSYASSTKVLIHCKHRFWESLPKYSIFGGASLSDQIIRSTYYPSDNVPPAYAPIMPSTARGVATGFSLTSPTTARVNDISNGPGVLLGSYCWGQDARRFGAMGHNERAERVVKCIARFHPEILQEADDHASMVWDQYPWAAGAFASMCPGDQSRYLQAGAESEGNIYFAGEHLSTDQGWIQGALISGLRAVEELVSS